MSSSPRPRRAEGWQDVVTGVPWRTGWRYAERGWRHLYRDGGTLVAQLSAAATSAGLNPRLRSRFPDAGIRDLVGADGVHEYPLALITFGDGEPAIGATGPASPGTLPTVEFPLCTSAQRAGERDDLGAPWPLGPALSDVPPSESLDQVVGRRGSQRSPAWGSPSIARAPAAAPVTPATVRMVTPRLTS